MLPTELKKTFASVFSQFAGGGDGGPQWDTVLPHNGRTIPGTGELEYYSDSSVGSNPFSVTNGTLNITATAGSPVAGLSYTSGVISTQTSFSQLYGYFDMTAILPAGMWPAFWLLPANLWGTAEIDIMEDFGGSPLQYTSTLHSPSSGISSASITTADLTTARHTYGMYWTPATISFYLDDEMVAIAPTPADMNTPMFMIANLAVARTVAPTTVFPATMEIASINAYAYDASVPGPTAPVSAMVPTTFASTLEKSAVVGGVQITGTGAAASDTIVVALSDKSLGTLSVIAAGATSVTINNGWTVQFSGTLADVNATLATLAYKNVPPTATAAKTDTLTVSATDTTTNAFDASRTAITLSSVTQAPTFVTMGATPSRVMATGHDVLSLTASAIADPKIQAGNVDAMVNFHTEARAVSAGTSDFLALHGFAPTATLVFDHYANNHGVPDHAMQYYRVDTPTGSSPIFMVQMANASPVHLGRADFGFYPS